MTNDAERQTSFGAQMEEINGSAGNNPSRQPKVSRDSGDLISRYERNPKPVSSTASDPIVALSPDSNSLQGFAIGEARCLLYKCRLFVRGFCCRQQPMPGGGCVKRPRQMTSIQWHRAGRFCLAKTHGIGRTADHRHPIGKDRVHRWWRPVGEAEDSVDAQTGTVLTGRPNVAFRKIVNATLPDGRVIGVNAQQYAILVMDVPDMVRERRRLSSVLF